MSHLSEVRSHLESNPVQAVRNLTELVGENIKSEHILPTAEIISRLVGKVHGMEERRIYVLGEPTTNAISAAVAVAAFRNGIVAEVQSGAYGALQQEILNPDSDLYRFLPHIVILVPNPFLQAEVYDAKSAESFVNNHVVSWVQLWSAIANALPGVHILQHLNESPDVTPVGIAERRLSWSMISLTTAVNTAMLEHDLEYIHFVDMDGLAAHIGRSGWHDKRLWFHGKLPFSPRHLAEYTGVLGGALRRALGRSRKALIVDLDNTLWGGVIGDDGLDGIKLGPGDALSEAYVSFCEYVKGLGRRGVILGVCSKNNPETASRVFIDHPHMPLNLEDFSIFTCNWDDKASNLRRMIAQLNIDPSAVVFADDSRFECGLVKQELPTVEVVELIGDAADFVNCIDRLRMFEADLLLDVDLARTASYMARGKAESFRTSAASLEEYLLGLKMQGEMWEARPRDISRMAQMEGKINQFNLTTQRFTSEQLTQFMESPNYGLYCFKLVDAFADHGIVGSMVVEYRSTEAHILSWLLSCRVFTRGCEEFMLKVLVRGARMLGASSVHGLYKNNEKNDIVADLYPRLGFKIAKEIDSYELSIEAEVPLISYIEEVSTSGNSVS